MNKEHISNQLESAWQRNPEISISDPGVLSPEITADHLITLLEDTYVQHAITNNRQEVIDDIRSGKVLTWFAFKQGEPIATASLVQQQPNGWELGRCVAKVRGCGVGKATIMAAAAHHMEHFGSEPLLAEVRIAEEFEGIAGGEATQKIFFDHLALTPHAVAPLFSHGDPERHEPFVLASSDLDQNKTIHDRIRDAIGGRSTRGSVPRLRRVWGTPFRLLVPDRNGKKAEEAIKSDEVVCTLIPIEVTDENMPLVGMLAANPEMVVCGVDRDLGENGKPILLIASLGFGGTVHPPTSSILAPAFVTTALPTRQRKSVEAVAREFEKAHEEKRRKHGAKFMQYWRDEMNHPPKGDFWEGEIIKI